MRAVSPLKTLHKYLVGQVSATLLLTVAVFAFVVMLLNVLKDVLPLLFGGHMSLWLFCKAIGLLLPFACVYALPMGFITATLLVFGRISTDQELTAARASGISLLSLISPVLLLSLFCCTLSAWFNLDIGPRSRVEFLNLRYELMHDLANSQLPAGQFIKYFPGYIFYTEKNHGGQLENVMIYRLQNETNVDTTIYAARGELKPDQANNQFILNLYDAHTVTIGGHGNTIGTVAYYPFILSLNNVTNRNTKPNISDMTFLRLRQELRELKQLSFVATDTNAPLDQASLHRLKLTVDTNSSPEEVAGILRKADQLRGEEISRVHVAMHREIAFSFACFGFTLVGIPLGIRVHRRETNVGIAMALVLVIVYYAFVMLGQSLSARPEFYPQLILWVPNFLFQAVGGVLLWRANRGI